MERYEVEKEKENVDGKWMNGVELNDEQQWEKNRLSHYYY
jgi:hypothetical protein